MRLRNIVSGIVYGAGAAMGFAGLIMLQAGGSVYHAMELVVAAIAFMCGGVVYMMATDDLESRRQMIPDEASIDLRSRQARSEPRQPVHA